MKIFVTGATGYIGSAIVTGLLAEGHQVIGLVRSAEQATRLRGRFGRGVVGDLKQPSSYRQAAASCDALIHAGFEMSAEAVTADRTAIETLLDCARSAGGHRVVVYTSGVWVLGSTGSRVADETAPPNPPQVVAWRPAHERLVLDAAKDGVAAVVVRPGIVYGEKRGSVAGFFQSAVQTGAARYVGDGANRWAMVHVTDLADLYRRVVHKRPAGHIFHATDGSHDTVRMIAEAASGAAGRGGKTEAWPPAQARAQLGPVADALVMDQQVSSAKAERDLGWSPRIRSCIEQIETVHHEWSR